MVRSYFNRLVKIVFLRWNITWIPYIGAVHFGIFDDQVLNPKGGCCDFWKNKNNSLKETAATSKNTQASYSES